MKTRIQPDKKNVLLDLLTKFRKSKNLIFLFLFIFFSIASIAQNDSIKIKKTQIDTAVQLNMDAVYNRPFLQYGKIPVAIGGYMEANTQYAITIRRHGQAASDPASP